MMDTEEKYKVVIIDDERSASLQRKTDTSVDK
jgi:hypothetical protein